MSTPTVPTVAGVPDSKPPKLEKKPVKFSNLLRKFRCHEKRRISELQLTEVHHCSRSWTEHV
jgi:hypothetical protein